MPYCRALPRDSKRCPFDQRQLLVQELANSVGVARNSEGYRQGNAFVGSVGSEEKKGLRRLYCQVRDYALSKAGMAVGRAVATSTEPSEWMITMVI